MQKRKESIDNMKGILTVLMVLAHISNVCINRVNLFSEYVNLTTFSGFMFCFGYACYNSYIKCDNPPVNKLLKGSIKIFVAYWLLAIACCCWEKRSIHELIFFLTLYDLVGYAEFLLSWAYLYLLLIFLIPIIKRIYEKKWYVNFAVLVSLLFTMIPYDKVDIPWLGPIIGMADGNYFPLIQYFSYFLWGGCLAKYKLVFNWKTMCLCVGSFLYFIVYTISNGLPMRWKPHIGWIIGGYLFVYLYYLLFEMIEQTNKKCSVLSFVGRNSLCFLLVSNFFLYLIEYLNVFKWEVSTFIKVMLWYIITMSTCVFVVKAFEKIRYKVGETQREK